VIVTGGGSPAALAAKTATSTIPIVLAVTSDPLEGGIVQSLARPDANVTGISLQSVEPMAKRLQLIGELIPNANCRRAACYSEAPNRPSKQKRVSKRCGCDGVRIEIVNASSEGEIESAFAELTGRWSADLSLWQTHSAIIGAKT